MSTVESPREVRAQAKYVRMSPRKARLVAEHIRGRSVPEARAVLAFTSREAAEVLQKVLQSAVSNVWPACTSCGGWSSVGTDEKPGSMIDTVGNVPSMQSFSKVL